MVLPSRSRRFRRLAAALGALGLSAGLHLLLAGVVWRLPVPPPVHVPRNPITITFQTVSPGKSVQQTEAPVPQASPAASRPAPSRPEQEPLRPEGQVVRLPPPRKVERPDQARFVSEFDRKVERETKARKTSPTATPAEEFHDEERAAPTHEEEEPEPPQERQAGQTLHMSSLATPEESYAGGGMMQMWRAAERRNRAGSAGGGYQWEEHTGQEGAAEAGAGSGERGEERETLTPDGTAKRAGGAPSNDAIDGVADGTGTLLNTRQWKYAAFFNRVSDAIKRQWSPNDALRPYRDQPELRRAGLRQTVVEMTLDRAGRVVRVRVDVASRVDILDDEALRACRAAGPFPNPPAGLFEDGDTFTFRFGFRVDFQHPRELELFTTDRMRGRRD